MDISKEQKEIYLLLAKWKLITPKNTMPEIWINVDLNFKNSYGGLWHTFDEAFDKMVVHANR